jgi:hypothetical protein
MEVGEVWRTACEPRIDERIIKFEQRGGGWKGFRDYPAINGVCGIVEGWTEGGLRCRVLWIP